MVDLSKFSRVRIFPITPNVQRNDLIEMLSLVCVIHDVTLTHDSAIIYVDDFSKGKDIVHFMNNGTIDGMIVRAIHVQDRLVLERANSSFKGDSAKIPVLTPREQHEPPHLLHHQQLKADSFKKNDQFHNSRFSKDIEKTTETIFNGENKYILNERPTEEVKKESRLNYNYDRKSFRIADNNDMRKSYNETTHENKNDNKNQEMRNDNNSIPTGRTREMSFSSSKSDSQLHDTAIRNYTLRSDIPRSPSPTRYPSKNGKHLSRHPRRNISSSSSSSYSRSSLQRTRRDSSRRHEDSSSDFSSHHPFVSRRRERYRSPSFSSERENIRDDPKYSRGFTSNSMHDRWMPSDRLKEIEETRAHGFRDSRGRGSRSRSRQDESGWRRGRDARSRSTSREKRQRYVRERERSRSSGSRENRRRSLNSERTPRGHGYRSHLSYEEASSRGSRNVEGRNRARDARGFYRTETERREQQWR